MKIIVCIDDGGGVMFNHRRQSRDRILTEDVLTLTEGSNLLMSEYSSKLFSEHAYRIKICGDVLSEAEKGDFCFLEGQSVLPYAKSLEEVVLYRWNRAYPADVYFDISLELLGFKLADVKEFEGSSHEKITREIFKKA